MFETSTEHPDLFMLFTLGLLAFARIVLIMVQAPIWGSRHYNAQIKVGTAAVITILAFPNLPIPDHFPKEIRGLILALLTQIAVGAAIGFASFIVMGAAQFGGEMLDIQMGLSVAASMDPSSHGASKLLQRLNFYVAMLLYLILDGHHKLMIAIFYSFKVVPLTGMKMTGAQIQSMINMVGDIFVLGTQIAAPALGALFITQVALGLLARVAPQMNVFMLSFPLNIAIGISIFVVALPYVVRLLTHSFAVNDEQVLDTIRMLWPKR